MYRDRLMTAKLRPARSEASARASSDLVAAQSFYRDVLGGRQLWPTEREARPESVWFFIAGRLIEVCPAPDNTAETLELCVESPASIAERCWDSGYTVQLPVDAPPGEIVVIDPFGRPITLIPRLSEYALGAEAAG